MALYSPVRIRVASLAAWRCARAVFNIFLLTLRGSVGGRNAVRQALRSAL